jgi:hypothetical protein
LRTSVGSFVVHEPSTAGSRETARSVDRAFLLTDAAVAIKGLPALSESNLFVLPCSRKLPAEQVIAKVSHKEAMQALSPLGDAQSTGNSRNGDRAVRRTVRGRILPEFSEFAEQNQKLLTIDRMSIEPDLNGLPESVCKVPVITDRIQLLDPPPSSPSRLHSAGGQAASVE